MSQISLSPSRLANYATCPRLYDYRYVQGVNAPDRTELYLNQGTIYHETIEDVCDATENDDAAEAIHSRAMEFFDAKWDEHSTSDDYESAAHQEYQRAENRAAIASFFNPDSGDGIKHARHSIETECEVECERDGRRLHGKADNVIRTDDGVHVIDYKRNLRDVLSKGTPSASVIISMANPTTLSEFGMRSRPRCTLRASRTNRSTRREWRSDSASTASSTARRLRARLLDTMCLRADGHEKLQRFTKTTMTRYGHSFGPLTTESRARPTIQNHSTSSMRRHVRTVTIGRCVQTACRRRYGNEQ